jgi:hypothetical protein
LTRARPRGRGGRGAGRGWTMCHPVKFSKLINMVNNINFSIEKIDKHAKFIEIVISTCHEKIDNKFRIKVLNDLLRKQKLRSSFVMYIDLYYDPEKNLILIDYPFYPLHK